MIRLFLNVCKTFQKIKHLNFNDYDLYLYLSAHSGTDSFSCPSCKAPEQVFTHNGSYKRHLVFINNNQIQDILIDIRNLKCTSCNRSHALLYSIIIPYCPYSSSFLIDLIYKRLTKQFKNVQQLCEFYDITERTFYRIWKRMLTDSHRMNVLLDTYGDILAAIDSLFHSESVFFHSFLERFFKSCGYSFLQPLITFRQSISKHVRSPGCIR